VLEKNRVYLGDFRELIKSVDDTSIDLIVTDPPYKMTSRGTNGTTGGMLTKAVVRSGQVFEHNDIEPSEYAAEFYRVLKDGSHCYVMTNHVNLINMLNSFTSAGFHFIKSLIWKKDNKVMGRFYMSQFEYILFLRKGFGKQINNCGTSDILEFPNKKDKAEDGSNLHDSQKPVEMMRVLIENSTVKGEVVLDPFMGSGSTPLAAKLSERDYIGFEIDSKYFNIANERLKNPFYLKKKLI
jgi:site-specific DNA-methyltransferase (adenine-specific)